ncbi:MULTISPECIES: anti-repressor SinI family protein [Bacillus]|nr:MULTISPECIES: anti-repressor SinI family protein [Bacillus]
MIATLEKEWAALILEAKKLGLTIEEVREFLHSKNNDEK